MRPLDGRLETGSPVQAQGQLVPRLDGELNALGAASAQLGHSPTKKLAAQTAAAPLRHHADERDLADARSDASAVLERPEFQRKMTGTELRYLLGKYYAAEEQRHAVDPAPWLGAAERLARRGARCGAVVTGAVVTAAGVVVTGAVVVAAGVVVTGAVGDVVTGVPLGRLP